jgi:zinc transport system substrate-binding protein
MHVKKLFYQKNIGIVVFLLFINFSLFSGTNLHVFTSIPPIAFFVEQIGGDSVKVNSIIDQRGNPHTYTPTPKQVVALGKTGIFFSIGIPFERPLIEKIKSLSNPPLIVDLTKGVKFITMRKSHEKCTHDHDHNTHNKGAVDPHVWLGFTQIKVLAANIADTLSSADPANSIKIKENLKVFLKKLNALDAKITKQLLPFKGDTIFVYHPSFGYFSNAFGIRQESVEIEGKSPSPRQIIKLITDAKKDKVKVIFVQPQFDTKAAANIARAINGSVVSMNPIEKDVFKNMEYMATKIAGVKKTSKIK